MFTPADWDDEPMGVHSRPVTEMDLAEFRALHDRWLATEASEPWMGWQLAEAVDVLLTEVRRLRELHPDHSSWVSSAEQTACPRCEDTALRIEMGWHAKPVGTFSLGGKQTKLSVYRWPILVCDSCDLRLAAQRGVDVPTEPDLSAVQPPAWPQRP